MRCGRQDHRARRRLIDGDRERLAGRAGADAGFARIASPPAGIDGTSVALVEHMPNPLVHWELMVSDVERAKAFYKRVFDWSFTASGPEYTLIACGDKPGGGLMKRPPHLAMSALNSYFQVPDLDRTLRDAVEAGATVIVPRTEVPTIGWFAMFLDPDKIPIGVMQLR